MTHDELQECQEAERQIDAGNFYIWNEDGTFTHASEIEQDANPAPPSESPSSNAKKTCIRGSE